MKTKEKLTVTIEKSLADELNRQATEKHVSRSSLVEEAVKLLKEKGLNNALKKGYIEMSKDNYAFAEQHVEYAQKILDENA